MSQLLPWVCSHVMAVNKNVSMLFPPDPYIFLFYLFIPMASRPSIRSSPLLPLLFLLSFLPLSFFYILVVSGYFYLSVSAPTFADPLYYNIMSLRI